jgi:hypothetical protein
VRHVERLTNIAKSKSQQEVWVARTRLDSWDPSISASHGLEKAAYAHTLSFRLTAEQYRQLRRFVTDYENRTDRRLTHQAVLEAALANYLNQNKGGSR